MDGKVAEDALKALFESRTDLVDALDFGETYWTTLTPESAFLVRAFAAYCQSIKDDAKFDECMPVVTALAFRMETAFTELIALVPAEGVQISVNEQVALAERIFVIKELLQLAVMLDYADENGRRKMFGLIRAYRHDLFHCFVDSVDNGPTGNMISHVDLPIDLMPFCLDVLLKLSNGERDFLQVVVEVVQIQREDANVAGSSCDQKDGSDEDSDEDDMVAEELTTPARKTVEFSTPTIDPEKAPTHLRCLAIVKSLLERILGVSPSSFSRL